MADAPTEEQVKESNEAEEAKWQDDFQEDDLKVDYKGEQPKTEGKPVDEDDEEESEATQEVIDDEEQEEYDDPEPVVTAQDPGDFQPKDYSFKVTLADGKKVTIKTPEEAEEVGEDPDNFATPKQLMNFITKSNKMINSLERDKEKYDADKKIHDEQVAIETGRAETVNTLASEFEYLETKGLLPKTPAKYRDVDWQDPEVAKQTGVKEKLEIIDYMVKENEARSKAGVKPITSAIDAYNAFQADTKRTEAETERKQAGQTRKKAGSRVAGVSPSSQGSYVPKGIAVGNPNVLKRGAAVWDN